MRANLLATVAALSIGTTLPVTAGTIYTNLASHAGAIESGIPLASHCGTGGCQFSVSDGHGGVVWFGIPTLPPPFNSALVTSTAGVVGYFIESLGWVSTHNEHAVLTAIAAAANPPKTIQWQLITGGTVPCQQEICGETEVPQVENVLLSQ